MGLAAGDERAPVFGPRHSQRTAQASPFFAMSNPGKKKRDLLGQLAIADGFKTDFSSSGLETMIRRSGMKVWDTPQARSEPHALVGVP